MRFLYFFCIFFSCVCASVSVCARTHTCVYLIKKPISWTTHSGPGIFRFTEAKGFWSRLYFVSTKMLWFCPLLCCLSWLVILDTRKLGLTLDWFWSFCFVSHTFSNCSSSLLLKITGASLLVINWTSTTHKKPRVSTVDHFRSDAIFIMRCPRSVSCYLNKNFSNQAMGAFVVLFMCFFSFLLSFMS